MKLGPVLLLTLLATPPLHADGSAVIAQETTRLWRVTVLSNVSPLVAEPFDFGIVVQDRTTLMPIRDAVAHVSIHPSGRQSTVLNATWQSDRQIYLAHWNDPVSGATEVEVRIERGGVQTWIPMRLVVGEAATPFRSVLPFIAVVPAGLILLALNRYLRSSQNRV